jgi:hypothetical protein
MLKISIDDKNFVEVEENISFEACIAVGKEMSTDRWAGGELLIKKQLRKLVIDGVEIQGDIFEKLKQSSMKLGTKVMTTLIEQYTEQMYGGEGEGKK